MICKNELKKLNSSQFCYVSSIIQLDVSHLSTYPIYPIYQPLHSGRI